MQIEIVLVDRRVQTDGHVNEPEGDTPAPDRPNPFVASDKGGPCGTWHGLVMRSSHLPAAVRKRHSRNPSTKSRRSRTRRQLRSHSSRLSGNRRSSCKGGTRQPHYESRGGDRLYSFLAIPSLLLVAVGVFSLFASPDAIGTITEKLAGIVPREALTLVDDSLTRVVENNAGSGIAMAAVGMVLAVWSLTGAMQTLMWALNSAYERQRDARLSQASAHSTGDGDLDAVRVCPRLRPACVRTAALWLDRQCRRHRGRYRLAVVDSPVAGTDPRLACRVRDNSLSRP